MTRARGDRKVFLGAVAGLIGSVAGLVIVYIVGVLVIFLKSQEVLATLLAAVTYLPLMLILVLFIPNLILGILIGLVLGLMGHWRSRLAGFGAAMVIGFICAEVILSLILPVIITPQPGDFVSILTDPYLTGAYGVTIGLLTKCFFSWFIPRQKLV